MYIIWTQKKNSDTVCLNILLKKIYHIGIGGSLHQIISSHLENRCQKQKMAMRFLIKIVVLGVPQGSILFPLLFISYINDMTSKLGSFYIFAYDTALMACTKTTYQLQC